MKKYLVLILLALVGIVVLATSEMDRSAESDEIVIGVTAPQTGNLAFLGESYVKAINMALEEVRTEYPALNLKVVVEDDSFDPSKGVSAVQKLISTNDAKVIFSFGSPVGNAVSPIAEQSKVVHINSVASDPNVAKGEWNFVHWTPPYEESALLVEELVKRGLGDVILLEQNQPGVQAVANALKPILEKNAVEIRANEKFNGDETDFRSMIAKIKRVNASIYIILATSPSLEILGKQIREAGITTPFTSIESFEFTEDSKLFEGAWYVNAADQTDEFISKYEARYGETPKLGAGNGYDSVKLIATAVAKSDASPESIKAELVKLSGYRGAMGELRADKDGIIVSNAVIRVINGGKPETLE